jgi:hypothetical protein
VLHRERVRVGDGEPLHRAGEAQRAVEPVGVRRHLFDETPAGEEHEHEAEEEAHAL